MIVIINKFKGPRPKEPALEKEKDNTFTEALAADTVQEGIEIIQAQRPRDYCLHGAQIKNNLVAAKKKKFKHAFLDFTVPLQELSTKALLIFGPTGCGKTQYACAHFKNPCVVRHTDDLKKLNPDHDGIVFDDFSVAHWPVNSVIHLLDWDLDSSINVKHGTACIPANTPKIFTYNNDNPFYAPEVLSEQQAAVERRLVRVKIDSRIY